VNSKQRHGFPLDPLEHIGIEAGLVYNLHVPSGRTLKRLLDLAE